MELNRNSITIDRLFNYTADESIVCIFCKCILDIEGSKLCSECGETFCKFCSNVEASSVCNICQKETLKINIDQKTRRKLKKLPLMCKHNGCKTIVEYDQLSTHEETCSFNIISCYACNEILLSKDYDRHISICDFVETNCVTCGFVGKKKNIHFCEEILYVNDKCETKFNKFVEEFNEKLELVASSKNQEIEEIKEVLKKRDEQIGKLIEVVLNLKERLDLLENWKKPPFNQKYKINNKKTFNILHFTSMDSYSPSRAVLEDCGNYTGVSLVVEETRGTVLDTIDLKGIDCILVSTWNNENVNGLGNFLMDSIDKGINVVIVLFSNTTYYPFPQGRFIHPLQPLMHDLNHTDNYSVLIPNHPLFEGNPTITVGTDKRRAIMHCRDPNVDVVACWEDQIPMIGVKSDLNALITTIGFQCGSAGSQDGIRVVVNALRMKKI